MSVKSRGCMYAVGSQCAKWDTAGEEVDRSDQRRPGVCVCVCVWVGVWVGGWVDVQARVSVYE